MTRRIWAFAISLFLIAAMVAGCGGSATQAPAAQSAPAAPKTEAKAPETKPAEPKQTSYPVTLKDGAGRNVTIPAEPKRVISVAPSNTELVFALNKQSILVGRSQFDDYPADVQQIESIGGFAPPNYEQIVGMKPDLILAIGGSKDAVDKLTNDYKLNVYVLNPQNFDGLYAGIKDLGVVLNAQEQAGKVVADMQQSVKEITDKVAQAKSKPKVFYEVWNDPLMTTGDGTFINDLIKLAGGENVGAAVKGWSNFSLEQLAAANPDIYFTSVKEEAPKVKERKGFENIKAVKESKVLAVVDENLIVRPGPRLVLGLKWFAETLHPELFTTK
jgi:iron complex transport system substrate-binding protein